MPTKQSTIPTHDVSTQTSHFFSALLNHIGDEVLVTNSFGRIVYVNDATVRGFGLPRAQIINQSITHFYSKKMTEASWQKNIFSHIKRINAPVPYRVERHVKGKHEVIDVTANYLKLGADEYMISVGRNITTQVQMESTLKRTEDLYSLLSHHAADAIVTISLGGIIQYVNQAAIDMFGWPENKVVKTHFINFIDRAHLPKAWHFFNSVCRGEKIQDEINVLHRTGKSVTTSFSSSPILQNGKIHQIVTIFRDITKQKEVEQLRLEADKMTALQHFISGAAQEIQYPLQGLNNLAKDLIKTYKHRDFEYISYKEFEHIIKTLETMSLQISSSTSTIDRLLNMSKRKAMQETGFCDINEVIRQTVKSIQANLTPTHCNLKLNLQNNIPLVKLGAIEANQVINQIILNAIQSLHAHGKIVLSSKYNPSTKMIAVTCKDDGIGIAKENLNRIFEPFFTTKQGRDNSKGLGLSIVYSIIKSINGDIQVRSTLRQGTTVEISLPAIQVESKKKRK